MFYADVVLDGGGDSSAEGCEGDVDAAASRAREIKIDARPSPDALALAARSNAPIYVEDEVMNRAGSHLAPIRHRPGLRKR